MKRVSVVGTGYVGLVTGACLAEKGHEVVCVDVDAEKVVQINAGVAPVFEPGLEEIMQKTLESKLLRVTTDLPRAVHETDVSLIAVGTPFGSRGIDLASVENASKEIGVALREKRDYHVVVVKSTVVPGTTDEVVLPLLEEASGKHAGPDFGVGMNPEFLREGEAVQDFMYPDRIVLGGIDTRTIGELEELYAAFDGTEFIRTNNRTAEMIKYAANSLLCTLISYSNEIGNLCAALSGIDVVDVMHGVHMDKRLSPILPDGRRVVPEFTTYQAAGCGFGGSCFPKDVRALIAHGEAAGEPMALLNAVIEINDRQPQRVIKLLEKHLRSLEGVRVAVLGLAFKPGTDDVRGSPSVPVIQDLLMRRAIVKAYDPEVNREAAKLFGFDITVCQSMTQVLEDVEAVILMTRWPEFQQLHELVGDRNPQPLVVDGRRFLDKRKFARYEGIGL